MVFLREYCRIDYVEVERLFDGMKSSLISVIRMSEAATEDADPAFEFMKAFTGLMETGQFKIKQGRLEEQELGVFDGFCDDKYIYVFESNFYEKTNKWLCMANLSPQMNLRQIEKLLDKEGYLVTSPNGPNKVTLCCRVKVGKMENKINFVKLLREKIQLVQQGKNPNSCL